MSFEAPQVTTTDVFVFLMTTGMPGAAGRSSKGTKKKKKRTSGEADR